MKLQEFVKETLREVIAGVKKAQTYAADNGAEVNPAAATKQPGKRRVPGSAGGFVVVQEIEFDVAVTSTDTTEGQAGVGIFVAGLGIGAKGKSGASNSRVSRIRFSVPIVLPVQNPPKTVAHSRSRR